MLQYGGDSSFRRRIAQGDLFASVVGIGSLEIIRRKDVAIMYAFEEDDDDDFDARKCTSNTHVRNGGPAVLPQIL